MSDAQAAATPQWREFEELSADIQTALAPQANVQRNVKRTGKRTGAERQIDILVEQEIGQYAITIVIDCKDYHSPVDGKDVEAFMGLVEDVGANKGAIIAASGFTSTAKKRAKDAGIDLYTLVDTNGSKWKSYVTIPCVIRDAFIQSFSFTFIASGETDYRFPLSDFRFTPVFRSDGTLIDYHQNLLIRRWETANAIPSTPSEYRDIPAWDGETYIKADAQLFKIQIRVNVLVAERLRFGQLPLEEVRGFNDELQGGLITNGFTTAKMNFQEIEQAWEPITCIDQLSIKPVFVLSVRSMPQRFEGSTSA
jgi:Restriction endonuclease